VSSADGDAEEEGEAAAGGAAAPEGGAAEGFWSCFCVAATPANAAASAAATGV